MHGGMLQTGRAPGDAGTRVATARPRVSLVVPARNEAANIGWVLERIPSIVDEIILVDGDSTDGTVAEARRVRPDVIVVGQDVPGKGAALRAGFAAASGDYVVMIDADCSMNPDEILAFIARLAGGCELVKGSRFMQGGGTADMSRIRRMGNACLLAMVNLLYGARFTDLCYGYCAFRRDALHRLGLRSDGFEIETEIVTRALRVGLRVGEVPSFESPRANGDSNLNAWRDGRRVLRTLLRERTGNASRELEHGSSTVSVALDAARNR
jgi:glycosyltransferase involved in cell wall biosynthesis